MISAIQILKDHGIENPTAIVAAINSSGIPAGVAMGMIMKETGGANIYGHDAGGACHGWGEVTEDNFRNNFLPVVLNGGTSNGVGPTQITYPGYFRQNPNYAWWDPYWNCLFGFNLLKGYCGGDYSFENLARAGSVYNSGTPTGAYNTYGLTFANFVVQWTDILSGADFGVDYNEEDDVPSAEEIANAILDASISRQEQDGETTLRYEIGWLPENFRRIPGNVWGYPVKRAGLPSTDDRAGGETDMQTIMAYQDAFVTDIKNTVVEAVRGITQNDEIVNKVEQAISKFIDYKSAAPGSVKAADLSDEYRVVQSGDTLLGIAERAGTTLRKIVELNPGIDPNGIVVGQKVKVY